MLVHELIEALNAMPPDWTVRRHDSEWGPDDITYMGGMIAPHFNMAEDGGVEGYVDYPFVVLV